MHDLAEVVVALRHLRTRYGAEPRAERRRLLRIAARCALDDAAALVDYHELLLFLCAFPDDEATLDTATMELRRVGAAAVTLGANGRRRDEKILTDSGIAGTVSHCQFSVQTATWLAERYPGDSEIAWAEETAGSGLETMLATLVEPGERNGLDDVSISTHTWFELARGKRGRSGESDLRWVLRHFARLRLAPLIRDHVFDLLELRIRWLLRSPIASRTFARFPRRRGHWQKQALTRGVEVSGVLDRPLAAVKRLRGAQARHLIDIARSVLAVRQRETDPVTFATTADVTVCDLGAGIDAALFGHGPAHRTPIETYYGYILARNRVPIAYGGGWVFCARCEIGLNIFDTFRGGESMNTFAQILRLYRHYFRIDRFTVDPYQIGSGNPEAIKTQAFWFYYRFGFRSQDPDTERIAEREWLRSHAAHDYRSPSRILRRLALHPLELNLKAVARDATFEPVELSLGVTRWVGERFAGERERARQWSIRTVKRALGAIDESHWRASERAAFDDLCLLVAPIRDLARWPCDDKRKLVALMRAKGGPREHVFAARLTRHERLRASWLALARSARVDTARVLR